MADRLYRKNEERRRYLDGDPSLFFLRSFALGERPILGRGGVRVNEEALVHELRAAGFSLRAEGQRLIIAPASRLSDTQRAAIRAEKANIIALLSGAPALLTFNPNVRDACPL